MNINSKHKSKERFMITNFVVLIICLLIVVFYTIYYTFYSNEFKIEARTKNIISEEKYNTIDKKVVAWVRVQGTNIDYPVLYAPSYNFSYETRDFAWTEADFKKLNNIVYISGHNIKNLSATPLLANKNHNRFEQLMSFVYYEFAKENQYIQYTIGKEEYLYKIYSVSFIDSSELALYNDRKYSKKELSSVIENTLDKSIYKYDVDVNSDDKIISLVTCTKMFEDDDIQFTVNARLLREGENRNISKISKADNYKKVEEKLKGGDSYDEA